jgi:hypothetical protein
VGCGCAGLGKRKGFLAGDASSGGAHQVRSEPGRRGFVVAVFGGWKIVNLGPFRFWRLPFRFVPDVEDPVSPCVSICLLAIGTAGSGSPGSAESLTREGA